MPLTLSKSRIEALSDGVFSIAMTLLVLKLEVPELMHHSSNEAMLQQLLALTPAFVTYVVTFLIAGGYWFLHHLTFHFIRHVDGVLVWINLIFLMLVSLLPFSAGLMGHLLVHPVSQLFYYGNQLALALVLNLHWHYARRKGLLGGAPASELAPLTILAGETAAAFAACLAMAVIVPAYSWIPLPVFCVVGLLVQRSRGRRLPGLRVETSKL
jgi:uncharacterized membrane protein